MILDLKMIDFWTSPTIIFRFLRYVQKFCPRPLVMNLNWYENLVAKFSLRSNNFDLVLLQELLFLLPLKGVGIFPTLVHLKLSQSLGVLSHLLLLGNLLEFWCNLFARNISFLIWILLVCHTFWLHEKTMWRQPTCLRFQDIRFIKLNAKQGAGIQRWIRRKN